MFAEAIAKRAWLASIESEPSWIQKASSVMPEGAAQQAWEAKLDAPTWEQVRPPSHPFAGTEQRVDARAAHAPVFARARL